MELLERALREELEIFEAYLSKEGTDRSKISPSTVETYRRGAEPFVDYVLGKLPPPTFVDV